MEGLSKNTKKVIMLDSRRWNLLLISVECFAFWATLKENKCDWQNGLNYVWNSAFEWKNKSFFWISYTSLLALIMTIQNKLISWFWFCLLTISKLRQLCQKYFIKKNRNIFDIRSKLICSEYRRRFSKPVCYKIGSAIVIRNQNFLSPERLMTFKTLEFFNFQIRLHFLAHIEL